MLQSGFSNRGWANFLSVLILLAAPVLAKIHLVFNVLLANPLFSYSGLTAVRAGGWLNGNPPTIDPNIAFTSHALGHRAAADLINGIIPWWNHFEGVGVPLAGEMQSAALFPLTLLLYFPNGQLYAHILLQIIAGVFTYFLLRRLSFCTLAACLGGLLFQFNGSFAWMANAVINPIPFLPVVLLGVEAVRDRLLAGHRGGWFWIAAGLALSLYAGFPEVAYLNGLLIACWVLVRASEMSGRTAIAFLVRIAAGTIGGLLLAAPILIAFLTFLPHAFVGGHTDNAFGGAHLASDHLVNLFLPYLYGPIFQQVEYWGDTGGYAGVGLTILAVIGFSVARIGRLRNLLAGWTILCIAASFGTPGIQELVTAVPGVGLSAFYRYLPPSWEFCLAVLAAGALDAVLKDGCSRRTMWIGIGGASLLMAAAFALSAGLLVRPPVPFWFAGSLALAGAGMAIGLASFLFIRKPVGRATTLSLLVAGEAILYFILPTFFYPGGKSRIDLGGVEFLQNNLGFQRFYTLGPIMPNYGAYFGISSINHNDLPLPKEWVDFVTHRLDDNTVDILFTGFSRAKPDGPTAGEALIRNLDAYRQTGVKYIVSPAGMNPFSWQPKELRPSPGPSEVMRLENGSRFTITVPTPPVGTAVGGVAITIANYGSQSDGAFRITMCSASQCVAGHRMLKESRDNTYFFIPLDRGLNVADGPLTIEVLYDGGQFPVALWAFPQTTDNTLSRDGQPIPGYMAKIWLEVSGRSAVRHVYGDGVMDIYELANPSPYFSAADCRITPLSRDKVETSCSSASTLQRRELLMDGWRAFVNGQESPIARVDDLFQQVAIPAGTATIEFRFRPPFMPAGYLAALLGLLITAQGLLPRKAAMPPTGSHADTGDATARGCSRRARG
ncbi:MULTISPECIES: hypothetical protein [unclassified Azospirillum]|uniref:hypothetical protein n=1 Tax=unclassified Azospirillum TaxID=2630922 RepID=UPI0011B1EE72|nr:MULTISPECIES: hypothetical protein [unclassified Azospirillum]